MANSRICSIPDCGKKHRGKGYCLAHYKRLLRHGDPLGGSTSRGDPLRFINEVALHHTGDDCLTWPFAKTSKGYGTVYVEGKMATVSRYVCELVNGPAPNPEYEASHSCGKGRQGCIAPGHLSWKTPVENAADKLEHGTHNRGARHGLSKLTEPEARDIIALNGIEKPRELAERFGVTPDTVRLIQRGKSWAWLSSPQSS